MSKATETPVKQSETEAGGDVPAWVFWLRTSLIGLVCLAFAGAAWAQGQLPGSEGKADGVPLSNQLYFLEIYFDSGERALVSAREGTLVTIRNEERYVGLAMKEDPVATSHNDQVRVVDVFEIRELPRNVGGEAVQQVGVSRAYTDAFVQFDSALGLNFDVRIVGVEEREFKTPFYQAGKLRPLHAPSLGLIAEFDEQCCAATCDGNILCGSSVDTFCSSCCSGEACKPSGGFNQAP